MREAIEAVRVDDWRDLGDAIEVMTEDGPATRLPKSEPVVIAWTPAGRLYVYPGSFDTAEQAAEFAAWVERVGTINPDRWSYLRGMYGTAAYFEDGYADLDKRLD